MTPFFWHVLAQDEKGGIITDRAKVLSGDTFELAAQDGRTSVMSSSWGPIGRPCLFEDFKLLHDLA